MSADKIGRAEMVLLTGNSHFELAKKIAGRIKSLESCKVYKKSNYETMVEIKNSIRGKDVFVIQTGTTNPNDNIMELLMIAYACKTACARKIIGVVPYIPYSQQSRVKNRGANAMRLIATLMSEAGFCHLITIDLHHKELQGFFNFPVDNLKAFPLMIDYIKKTVTDCTNAVIVARHPSQAKRANAFAANLGLSLAVIHGSTESQQQCDEDEVTEAYPSSGGDSIVLSNLTDDQVENCDDEGSPRLDSGGAVVVDVSCEQHTPDSDVLECTANGNSDHQSINRNNHHANSLLLGLSTPSRKPGKPALSGG